jgi:hypothetical protein
MEHSDYIVYADESGDHGIARLNPSYPIFVLAFCIFHKAELARVVVPELLRFKLEFFGHDQVVLHEEEIRKKTGPFVFLNDPAQRDRFHTALTDIMAALPVTLVAVVIRKERLVRRYELPPNPYLLSMKYGLERVCAFLREKGQEGRLTHFVFERRGAREDAELELEFRRESGPGKAICHQTPAEIIMADKKSISTGLQVADLVARPIGIRALRPDQPNRAYEIIERKFLRGPNDQTKGFGLKVFP